MTKLQLLKRDRSVCYDETQHFYYIRGRRYFATQNRRLLDLGVVACQLSTPFQNSQNALRMLCLSVLTLILTVRGVPQKKRLPLTPMFGDNQESGRAFYREISG